MGCLGFLWGGGVDFVLGLLCYLFYYSLFVLLFRVCFVLLLLFCLISGGVGGGRGRDIGYVAVKIRTYFILPLRVMSIKMLSHLAVHISFIRS